MARTHHHLTHWAQYIALRLASGLFEPYPPHQSIQTAKAFATLYARFAHRRTARARDNIARSFPAWSAAQADATALASVRNMFELFMVDAFVMPKVVHAWSWPEYIELRDFGPALDHLLGDEPCIFLTGHLGNWELLGYFLALAGFRMTALARPLDNPIVSDWLFASRQATGLRVITKWGATEALQRIVTGGRRSGNKIAFIADQNAGDDGVFVPFFGRLASSYKSIGLLAMHYRLPIVVGMARRIGEQFRYEVSSEDVIRPEEWDAQPDPLYYITARYNRGIEAMVRRTPEQYLWIHRRWKSRPKHEREGTELPRRLRSKLEGLPWMTEELLASCAIPVPATPYTARP